MEVLDLFLIPDLANLVNEYAKDNTQYNEVIRELTKYNNHYKNKGELLRPLYSSFQQVCLILIKLSKMK